MFDPNKMIRESQAQIRKAQASIEENRRKDEEHKQRQEEREIESLEIQREMRDSIPKIMALMKANNDVSLEIFILFQDLNKIMLAKNEEEAQGVINDVLTRAEKIKNGADILVGLKQHGFALKEMAKMYFDNPM